MEEASKFGFSGGGHDVAEDVADGVDGTVAGWLAGGWLGGIVGTGAEEEVTANVAFGFGFREVGGIAVYVEDHVAGMVADDGIWMSGGVVQKVG